MKQKFLESKYRDDIVALTAMILLASERSTTLGWVMLAGVAFSIIPRLITVHYSDDIRSKAERIRAAVLFCLYFFLALWSTDWSDTSMQPYVMSFLFGAAFYQLLLWLLISTATKPHSELLDSPKESLQRFAAVFLFCSLMFSFGLIEGETARQASRGFSILMIFVLSRLYRAGKNPEWS